MSVSGEGDRAARGDTRRPTARRFVKSLSRVPPAWLASRVLTAGDADRQRIEQDLHDGGQQRLTGLRIRHAPPCSELPGARRHRRQRGIERVRRGGPAGHRRGPRIRARCLSTDADLRRTECGTGLRQPARRRADHGVSSHGVRRCRPAVYFTCLAAIDNAAKHAGPAEVYVRAWDTAQALHFTPATRAAGLTPTRRREGGRTKQHERPHRRRRRHPRRSLETSPRNAATRQHSGPLAGRRTATHRPSRPSARRSRRPLGITRDLGLRRRAPRR
jgi:hypothetical protein